MDEMKKAAPTAAEVTSEVIEGWKKKYGDVFVIEADGKRAWLRRPDRKIIGAAAVLGGENPIKQKEVMLRNVWLGGDEELRDDDRYFLGLAGQLDALVDIAQVSLKKA